MINNMEGERRATMGKKGIQAPIETMVIYTPNLNIPQIIPPMVGGKYIKTIVLSLRFGCNLDLSYYSGLRNVFINLIGVITKKNIIDDVNKRRSNEGKFDYIGIVTTFKINKNENETVFTNTCSPYKLQITRPDGHIYNEDHPNQTVGKSHVKCRNKETNVWVINNDQYDEILSKI